MRTTPLLISLALLALGSCHSHGSVATDSRMAIAAHSHTRLTLTDSLVQSLHIRIDSVSIRADSARCRITYHGVEATGSTAAARTAQAVVSDTIAAVQSVSATPAPTRGTPGVPRALRAALLALLGAAALWAACRKK